MIYAKTDTFVEAEVNDEILVMNVETGLCSAIAGSARAIWQAVDGKRGVEEIRTMLGGRYDVSPETCAEEVTAFLQELEHAKLLVRV